LLGQMCMEGDCRSNFIIRSCGTRWVR
jgi:hypothetical protein